ncbi:unnamed protein product, partial [marine sediment metagenome]
HRLRYLAPVSFDYQRQGKELSRKKAAGNLGIPPLDWVGHEK